MEKNREKKRPPIMDDPKKKKLKLYDSFIIA